MSNEDSTLGTTRRGPRQGVGGSPVGSWLTIGLAVFAVIVGFLIFQNILDDGGTSTLPDSGVDEGTPELDPDDLVDVSIPTSEATATTDAPATKVTAGATVIVANASGVGGSAGDMSTELQGAGYEMIDPTNAAGGANLADTVVYFAADLPAAEAVAGSVARDLGGVDALPLPTPAPVAGEDIGAATVLVMLGTNEANKSIEDLSAATATPEAPPSAASPATTEG